jgi:hypothetical protein
VGHVPCVQETLKATVGAEPLLIADFWTRCAETGPGFPAGPVPPITKAISLSVSAVS